MDEISEQKRRENESLQEDLKRRFADAEAKFASLEKRADFSKKIQYKNGNMYEGEVAFNKPHGFGTKTYPDGRKYIGEFHGGVKQGIGIEYLQDGSHYCGEWVKNAKSGHGVFTKVYDLGNTTVYNGTWKCGKEDGEGIYYYSNGTYFAGLWESGELIDELSRDIDLTIGGCIDKTNEMFKKIYEEKDADGFYKKYR